MMCIYRGDTVDGVAVGHALAGSVVRLTTGEERVHEDCSDLESASDSDDDGEGVA